MSADETDSELIIRRELRFVRRIALKGANLTIGRAAQCDIALEHPSVSRTHARLERRPAGWFVLDNGSTNGVLLNGCLVHEAPLRPGDVLEVRPFSLECVRRDGLPRDLSIQFLDSGGVHTAARVSMSSAGVVRQRLEDLYALARVVIERREAGGFWPAIQAALQRSLGARRCVLMGLGESDELYRLVPEPSGARSAEPLVLSKSVVHDVIQARDSVLVTRVEQDAKYAQAASLVSSGVGSVLCAPLVYQGRTRALVYAERTLLDRPFGREDLEFVAAAVDLAAAAAEIDTLHDAARELARVQGRIEAGREIQEHLLPNPIPQPPWGTVAAANLPAERMSGDIYDVVLDPAGRMVVTLADVAGKGVPAALLTAILQNTLRLVMSQTDDLTAIVEHLNRSIQSYGSMGTFATMILCRWSPDGRAAEIANAGHPPPLWLCADGRCEPFPTRVGLPLGVDTPWKGSVVHRAAADTVAMLAYSDGANEARAPSGEQYGNERITQLFARSDGAPATQIVADIAADVRRFCAPQPPEDDVSLLVVKRAAVG